MVGLIIAAYAGVGKSVFAQKYPDETIDLCSMPYSWLLPKGHGGEHEEDKGARHLLGDPAYPDNYVLAILKAQKKYKYVLIPPISWILWNLTHGYHLPCILCYPQMNLKEEYKARYLQRGNSADFLKIFVGQWEDRIAELMHEYSDAFHIVLSSGMFLTDVKAEIDRLSEAEQESPKVNLDGEIKEYEEAVQFALKGGCIAVYEGEDRKKCYYLPLDLSMEENRCFAYEIGKRYRERGIEKGINIKGEGVEWVNLLELESRMELHSREELIDLLNNL